MGRGQADRWAKRVGIQGHTSEKHPIVSRNAPSYDHTDGALRVSHDHHHAATPTSLLLFSFKRAEPFPAPEMVHEAKRGCQRGSFLLYSTEGKRVPSACRRVVMHADAMSRGTQCLAALTAIPTEENTKRRDAGSVLRTTGCKKSGSTLTP